MSHFIVACWRHFFFFPSFFFVDLCTKRAFLGFCISYEVHTYMFGFCVYYYCTRFCRVWFRKDMFFKGTFFSTAHAFPPTPQNSQDIVRFLLKAGASPDAPDEAGITPAQLTKRDDISLALAEATKNAADRRQAPPPPPPPAA